MMSAVLILDLASQRAATRAPATGVGATVTA